jgi:hypothetical protein
LNCSDLVGEEPGKQEEPGKTPDLVLSAAQVLHERVPSRRGARRAGRLQSAHGPQSGLEPAVIGFDAAVRVLLEDLPRGRDELVDDVAASRSRDLELVRPRVRPRFAEG